MNIGRKQALAAIAAGIVGVLPWVRKSAMAATPPSPPSSPPSEPPLDTPIVPIVPVRPPDAATIEDLKKRVAALEAALASQVGFTKDAAGNLTLRSAGHVHVTAATTVTVASAAAMTFKGATINLN